MDLLKQRVLVTGASGFIGNHAARRLVGQAAAVRGLVRDVSKARDLESLGIELVRGDLTDVASLERAVRDCSLVIHAAAQVSSVPNRETFERSNVRGTENILRISADSGIARFVHLSSIAVFGLATSGEVTDQSPRHHSGDPYCDTKLDAEEVALRFQREGRMGVTVLRPSAVYGPGSAHWSVIPLKRIKKGKMILFGRGHGALNYVYIDNLVDAILLAAAHERAIGEAFIVNDGATTWREYFNAYGRMARRNDIRSIPLWTAKLWVRGRNLLAVLRREPHRVHPNALGFLVARAIYRQTHIEEKLGHSSRVGLEEGLRRTEEWFRKTGLL